MKIFYLCRIFNGLVSSIKSEKWQPTGVPTIYKMIEKLDKSDCEVKFFFSDWLSKNGRTNFSENFNKKIFIKGLKSEIRLISSDFFFIKVIKTKMLRILVEIKKQLLTLFFLFKFNPDIVYVDRANILFGAICSRFLKKKVVLRIMGIYPSMWEIVEKKNFFNFFYRWCFRSNFSLVICTEDGTGGDQWMKKILRNNVKRISILNGVDYDYPKKQAAILPNNFNKNKVNILFKGRLEKIKGCYHFINSFRYLNSEEKSKINIILIGSGTEEEGIIQLVKKLGLESFFFHFKNIPHRKIFLYQNISDIYVALNQAGNLSNSNLECFSTGLCCIIPAARQKHFWDVNIKKYFNNNELIRIPWKNQEKELSVVLKKLIKDKSKIKFYSDNVLKKSEKILNSWNYRTRKEFKLLKGIYDN